jgi:hypothetical protein
MSTRTAFIIGLLTLPALIIAGLLVIRATVIVYRWATRYRPGFVCRDLRERAEQGAAVALSSRVVVIRLPFSRALVLKSLTDFRDPEFTQHLLPVRQALEECAAKVNGGTKA